MVGVDGLGAGAASADGEAAGVQGGSALAGGCRFRPTEFEERRGHLPEVRVRRAGGWRYVRVASLRGAGCRRRRGSGGGVGLTLQDVCGGISLCQDLADVRHPSGRGGRDGVGAVVVEPVEEGVGQLMDNRVVANARRRVGAGGRWRGCRGNVHSRRKVGARGRRGS